MRPDDDGWAHRHDLTGTQLHGIGRRGGTPRVVLKSYNVNFAISLYGIPQPLNVYLRHGHHGRHHLADLLPVRHQLVPLVYIRLYCLKQRLKVRKEVLITV